MKSFIAAATVLALVGSSIAAPSPLRHAKRQSGCTAPSVQQVEDAINQWNSDVLVVNNFLETAATFTLPIDLTNAINTAATAATNEPVQLGILECDPDNLANPAVNDLKSVFDSQVIATLNNLRSQAQIFFLDDNIIDEGVVTANVNIINQARCCHVLPDLDSIWEVAAADNGLVGSVPPSAPRPSACSSISC